MNTVVRVLLGISILLVAICASVFVFVNSLDNDRARKWIFPLVEKYSGYEIEVPGTIDTKLRRLLEFEMSRGELKSPDVEKKGEETLNLKLSWEHVLLRIDPIDLFMGQIGLKNVTVEALEAVVRPEKKVGDLNRKNDAFSLPIGITIHAIDLFNVAIHLTSAEGSTDITVDRLEGSLRISSGDVPVMASDLRLGSLTIKAPLTLNEGPLEEAIEEVSGINIPDSKTDRDSVMGELYGLLEQPPLYFDQLKVAVDTVSAGTWKTSNVESSIKWDKQKLEASVALGDPVSKITASVDIPERTLDFKGDLRHFAIGPVINSIVTFGYLPRSIKEDILTGYLQAFATIETSGATTDAFINNLNGKIYLIVEEGSIDATIVEALGFDIAETVLSLLSGNQNIPINCMVADIEIHDGATNGEHFIVETSDSKIKGGGKIDLVTSTIDYRLSVEARDTSPLSVPAPIFIRGSLTKPTFSVEKKALAKEMLTIVIQPAEAFIDWIRGKDEEAAEKSISRCEKLLAH